MKRIKNTRMEKLRARSWEDEDRAWFSANPSHGLRIREPFAGEIEDIQREKGRAVAYIDSLGQEAATYGAGEAALVVLSLVLPTAARNVRMVTLRVAPPGDDPFFVLHLPSGREVFSEGELRRVMDSLANKHRAQARAQGDAAAERPELHCVGCNEDKPSVSVLFTVVPFSAPLPHGPSIEQLLCVPCSQNNGLRGQFRRIGAGIYLNEDDAKAWQEKKASPELMQAMEAAQNELSALVRAARARPQGAGPV